MPSPTGTVPQRLSSAGRAQGQRGPLTAPNAVRGWTRARVHPGGPVRKGWTQGGDMRPKYIQGQRWTGGQATTSIRRIYPGDDLPQHRAEGHPGGRAWGTHSGVAGADADFSSLRLNRAPGPVSGGPGGGWQSGLLGYSGPWQCHVKKASHSAVLCITGELTLFFFALCSFIVAFSCQLFHLLIWLNLNVVDLCCKWAISA